MIGVPLFHTAVQNFCTKQEVMAENNRSEFDWGTSKKNDRIVINSSELLFQ